MSINISCVIPVFNECESVGRVVQSLKTALQGAGIGQEIICVNDASTDRTAEVLRSIDGIEVVTHRQNRGYGSSIKSGIERARHPVVVTLDADGQHLPEDVIKAIHAYFDEKVDMVIGARAAAPTTSQRKWGKLLLRAMAHWLFDIEKMDFNSGLRVYDGAVAKRYHGLCSNRFSYSTSITCSYLSAGHEVIMVPISTELRTSGQSRVRIKDGFRTIWRMLTIAMAFRPFKVFKPILLLQAVVAVSILAHDIWVNNIGDASVVMISGFFNMVVLALIAEQVASLRRG